MTTRTVALLLSSAVSVAFSLAAFSEPAPAPAPAAAAPASSSDENAIAEIVVTAEKRNENLETVPVAISAYTAKTRDLIGIETIQDMTNFTPGLAYSTSLDRAFIRGVGRETNNLSTQPGVATYADSVYNSSVVAASGDSMFEDRIEVSARSARDFVRTQRHCRHDQLHFKAADARLDGRGASQARQFPNPRFRRLCVRSDHRYHAIQIRRLPELSGRGLLQKHLQRQRLKAARAARQCLLLGRAVRMGHHARCGILVEIRSIGLYQFVSCAAGHTWFV